jgi:hypothetical protein
MRQVILLSYLLQERSGPRARSTSFVPPTIRVKVMSDFKYNLCRNGNQRGLGTYGNNIVSKRALRTSGE